MNSELDSLCDELSWRISGVYNDLKAFLYIRVHDLQHKNDDIGGGNIASAIVIFSTLSLLAKASYFCDRPDKFDSVTSEVDETAAFIFLARELKAQSIINELPDDGETLRLIWNGFRNHLAHRVTVENGKSVVLYSFEDGNDTNIVDILSNMAKREVFSHDGNNRNWKIYGDVLHAKLPAIAAYACSKLRNSTNLDVEMLKGIIG